MEVKAAHAGGGSERIEVRHILSGLDQMASLRHRCGVLFGERRLVRPAPFAGPEARLFSSRTSRGNGHARGASRAAQDGRQ